MINEALDTLAGTTSKAGPAGLGVDRTGIADYLAWTFFGSLRDV